MQYMRALCGACPRSLGGNDLTDKSVPALAAALAHLPNLKTL